MPTIMDAFEPLVRDLSPREREIVLAALAEIQSVSGIVGGPMGRRLIVPIIEGGRAYFANRKLRLGPDGLTLESTEDFDANIMRINRITDKGPPLAQTSLAFFALSTYATIEGGEGGASPDGMQIRFTTTPEIHFYRNTIGNQLLKIASNGIVFNEDALAGLDVRMEGGTDPNLFFLDAGLDLVNIEKLAVHDYEDLEEAAEPGTPGAGYVRQYAKAGGGVYLKDEAGQESVLAPIIFSDNTYARKISNSTAWTSLFSFTLPGGVLGPDDGLRIEVNCTYQNNTGGTRALDSRIVVGGVNHQFTAADNIGTSALVRSYQYRTYFGNQASVSANRLFHTNINFGAAPVTATPNVNTGASVTFNVQAKFDAASTSLWMDLYQAKVEIIRDQA